MLKRMLGVPHGLLLRKCFNLVHFKRSYGSCLNVWMLLGQWIFHMKQVVII